MPKFAYRARSKEGKEVKGTLTAVNESRAQVLLEENGLFPLSIEATEKKSFLNREIGRRHISTKDLALFSRQLAAMVRSGVPILEAVKSLEKQTDRPAISRLLKEVAFDIEGGESLSVTLSKHPEVFSLFFLGVIRTGEASGRLSESLEILAEYMERNYEFLRKIRTALMYPLFVLTAVIIVVILMFAFVVPPLVALFTEANVVLPLPTRILIAITEFGGSYWYVVLAIIAALAIVFRSYSRTQEGRYAISSWALHIPLFSQLFRKVYLARLTSIMHTLFASDVPVLETLTIAQSSIGNRVYQKILGHTIEAVKDGAAISTVWQQEPFIPTMLTTMVSVGERSGEIEQAFKEAHDFFQRDVEEILDSVTVFLEPALVILLAIGVAIVVAAVLLPIYNLVLVL